MKLGTVDYALVRLASAASPWMAWLGDRETAVMRSELDRIPLETPLFISGLARSGTTVLLEELTGTGHFGTHCYQDFPFVMTPAWWQKFLGRFAVAQEPVERAHRDRIRITPQSPEAFEEPIWQTFFPHIHAADRLHQIDATTEHPEFERFYRDHLRKVLMLRSRRRYLSKGNYNFTRLPYITRILPDARFVIPVRHPVDHVHSLVRQHQLFTSYAQDDRRIGRYLAAAGHYEFGPQRMPIRLTESGASRIETAWQRGDEYGGYAAQWHEVYRFIDAMRQSPDTAQHILIVRYEDFCQDPHGTLAGVLKHADCDATHLGEKNWDHISPPTRKDGEIPDAVRDQVWAEVAEVASRFGYESAAN
ncbi:MAG: sulfotransferase [Planctomycetaceae bacterium]|nr:sulfotransferase [Planctomycetaceae bacterium]